MHRGIHKFYQNGMYILLDVNSSTVHLVDEAVYKIMDYYMGDNDEEVISKLKDEINEEDIKEILGELKILEKRGELFAPEITEPPYFKENALVKSMCLLVAEDCNLRCKYCFAGTGDIGHDRRLMTKEVGKAAVDFIIKNSGNRQHCEIDFFGGEPLINMPVVKYVTEYVRQREKETNKIFKLTLTTNGMLLNDENIKWLNDNNISLVLSLDGRKEVHDNMRPDVGGRGSYEKVLGNFKKMVATREGREYFLRGTFTKENMDFSKDVLSMADEGFDILSVEPVVLKDNPLGFTKEDLPKIFAEYDKLTELYLKRQKEGKGFFFFHFNVDLEHGPCVAKRLSGCGAGHEYYAVAADGNMYPCHQFAGRENYMLGNVFDGVKNTTLPMEFRNAHVLSKEECKNCWAKFFCSGGCHANADLFNEDIYKPYDIGCELQKKRCECALVVQTAKKFDLV